MPAPSPARPPIRDVTLRDGLQLARGTLPTDRKLAVARTLLGNGIATLEIGAVVRSDRVPAMTDTLELLGMLDDDERARAWVLVPNLTGARRALDGGARRIEYVVSVSGAHNRANVGRDTDASLAELPEILRLAGEADATVQVSLATAFTCPFEGAVDPARVLALLGDPRLEGVASIALCDTIGQAIPAEVTSLIGWVRERVDADCWLVFHGHDTWGQGVANSLAAIAAGAETVDGALGGLGGCPFAPGASGNTATEDLIYALRPAWLTPDRFRTLVRTGHEVLEAVGEPQHSAAAHAATRSPESHPWALGNRQG